jgi:hypothetical protein
MNQRAANVCNKADGPEHQQHHENGPQHDTPLAPRGRISLAHIDFIVPADCRSVLTPVKASPMPL